MYKDTGLPGDKEITFVSLGGIGEIGMNMYMYGYKGKYIVVDCGISFADPSIPGADVLLPDPTFMEENLDNVVGMFITHAHEDHIGAVPYLCDLFSDIPIYATSYAQGILTRKLAEDNPEDIAEMDIRDLPINTDITVGDFTVQAIHMTHSIPEPRALAIKTPVGTLFHTGDWKLDNNPVMGDPTDMKALEKLGKDGVLAVIGDSTNASTKGHSRAEGDSAESLGELFQDIQEYGRIAIGCFASNVVRVQAIMRHAQSIGRQVCLVGRSMHRMQDVCRDCGMWGDDLPPTLDMEDALELPRNEVVFICTGSQGEGRAALARIARDDHPIGMGQGDVAIFSSSEIPGNELAIGRVQNNFARNGVEVITSQENGIHVSGHGRADEFKILYNVLKPKFVIPVHGEARHQLAHARLAVECGAEDTPILTNGEMVSITPKGIENVDEIFTSRLFLEGQRILDTNSNVIIERRRISWNGIAFVTVVINGKNQLVQDPQVTADGMFDMADDESMSIVPAIERAVGKLNRRAKADDVEDAVRHSARRELGKITEKRPVVRVHVIQV